MVEGLRGRLEVWVDVSLSLSASAPHTTPSQELCYIQAGRRELAVAYEDSGIDLLDNGGLGCRDSNGEVLGCGVDSGIGRASTMRAAAV